MTSVAPRYAEARHSYKDRPWREKEFITPKEIAVILDCSMTAVYPIVNSLPHVRVGKSYRVATKAFEKWIRDQERMSTR